MTYKKLVEERRVPKTSILIQLFDDNTVKVGNKFLPFIYQNKREAQIAFMASFYTLVLTTSETQNDT